MTKHEAEATARQMGAAGLRVTGFRRYDRGSWAVDATDPQTGYNITVDTPEQWAERSNGATPTPGARLKYGTERTEQHSVTLPASLWRWVEELGDGNRSAGTAKGLLAALNGEQEAQ